jgi:hypothetical protein
MKTRKLWLGLGAAALSSTMIPQAPQAASSATAIDATAQSSRCTAQGRLLLAENTQAPAPAHSHGAPAQATPAGDGGEGGEGAANAEADARLEPSLRFYRDIQLVRGHLLVGDELIKAGRWADALPHFLHPVEELYDHLAPQLKEMKLKPFLQQLKSLAQTVKAKSQAAYDAALKATDARLDPIDAHMKAAKTDWMPFAVETALETLRTAHGEYSQSIEGGKFAKAVEYQDSRGFVWQAERLIASVGGELDAKHPDAAKKLHAELAVLKSAWPAVLPPAAPVLDPSQVAGTISKIELALGSVK